MKIRLGKRLGFLIAALVALSAMVASVQTAKAGPPKLITPTRPPLISPVLP
jgi:hypothetical protein